MGATWQLAQVNVARLAAPAGDPLVSEFFDRLDEVNRLAEQSPGYLWRLQDQSGNATAFQPTPDPRLIVNMSVWEDAESLFAFVYRSAHTPVMARRRDWFTPFGGAHQALWWIEAGKYPTIEDGLSRLWMLDRFGPTSHAFTFKARHAAPGAIGEPIDMQPDPWCIGRA